MSYIRKTEDEFNILGNYGQGFELVTCETTRSLARGTLRDYRKNEPGIPFKIVKKRVRKDPSKEFGFHGIPKTGSSLKKGDKVVEYRVKGDKVVTRKYRVQ